MVPTQQLSRTRIELILSTQQADRSNLSATMQHLITYFGYKCMQLQYLVLARVLNSSNLI